VPAGTVALHEVDEEQLTAVAEVGPKSTLVAPAVVEKPVPVTVTAVPAAPELGKTEVTLGKDDDALMVASTPVVATPRATSMDFAPPGDAEPLYHCGP
jgi:hypothetical protein